MKRILLAVALCSIAGSASTAPKPVFQPPLAVQERPTHVPARPPRVSRRRILALENLPGADAYEKLKGLFEKDGRAPSTKDLTEPYSGWIAFAGLPARGYGALLIEMIPISSPQASLDLYQKISETDLKVFRKSAIESAKNLSAPKFERDKVSYAVRDGRFKDDRYYFKKIREGIVMKTVRAGHGNITYAFFFKKITPIPTATP